ncbi:MAG: SulP family inorganic anion transporter [Bacteroidota bacterium]
MSSNSNQNIFQNLKSDIPASIVVFFVAIPLCLGIALASGVEDNLFSGLIAGIIGGIVVGLISGSQIGVSGPAAGLAAIVLGAIKELGSFEIFLVAVVLGGLIQILFGILRLGIIGYYFPSSVIKGMLTGIGIIIIMKQIPYFLGISKDTWDNTSALDFAAIFSNLELGAVLIGCISIAILLFWSGVLAKKAKIFNLIQGPLAVVVLGVIYYLTTQGSSIQVSQFNLVNVPVPKDIDSFFGQFTFPDFSAIWNKDVWIVAFTIALVASLETLLCVEATDKLDPQKRITPTNRELFAQGIGNSLSGLIGGLPITQVIVRSSANIQSGGKTKASAVIHGFLLLISVIAIPNLLNLIPFSVLAAILFIVGFKLAKPKLFVEMYQNGWKQFVPFIITVGGIAITQDLLIGIGLGLAVGIVVILWKSYKNSHFLHIQDVSNGIKRIKMRLAEEVTFINKGAILKELNKIEDNSALEIDMRATKFLDYDIIEIFEDFADHAKASNINFKIIAKDHELVNPEASTIALELAPTL